MVQMIYRIIIKFFAQKALRMYDTDVFTFLNNQNVSECKVIFLIFIV